MRAARVRRFAWLALGLLLLMGIEVLRVHLIMPLPGSQRADSIGLAYFLHRSIWILRIGVLVVILPALWGTFARGSNVMRVLAVVAVLAYAAVFHVTNTTLAAERMFLQPRHVIFASSEVSTVPLDRLVVGIAARGDAGAYPIELIGYHHQVQDQLGGEAVLVTYCTVCRTGRVYDPAVDGRAEKFRLVGMDHFNALFEDASTRSWWRQATGEAVVGPRKGMRLAEIASEQMTLREWLRRHPRSRILQPDPDFHPEYRALRGFDDGTRGGSLTGRNHESWSGKSWVVGVVEGAQARAYDWNDLQRLGTINDRLGNLPVVLWISPDSASFSARRRAVDGRELTFSRDSPAGALEDAETGSRWDEDGTCVAGPLAGARLPAVRSYQEFWHSWKSFHPETDTYRP